MPRRSSLIVATVLVLSALTPGPAGAWADTHPSSGRLAAHAARVTVDSGWRAASFPEDLTTAAVDCPRDGHCYALAQDDYTDVYRRPTWLLEFTGTSWVRSQYLGKWNDAAIDCADDGFCMMYIGRYVGRHQVKSQYRSATYRGGRWSKFTAMPATPTHRVNGLRWRGMYFDLDCVSRQFCAVGMGGRTVEFDPKDTSCCGSGGWLVTWTPQRRRVKPVLWDWMKPTKTSTHSRWSSPMRATPRDHLWTFDCVTKRLCVALDSQTSRTSKFNPALSKLLGPTAKVSVGDYELGPDIECLSARRCFLSGPTSRLAGWDGHRWRPQMAVGTGMDLLACRDRQICLGVRARTDKDDDYAAVSRFTGSTWSNFSVIDTAPYTSHFGNPSGPGPVFGNHGVACASRNFCIIAANGRSYVTTE